MPRAECYYDILQIKEDVPQEEIKKAYRSLALIWHPDKNQTDEAHTRFQTILKAYETLNDPRERDWYDRHKDQILSGCDGNDYDASGKFMDLFPFFSSACYANFDDSEDGFYTIYRKVFEDIANEETTYSTNRSSKRAKNPRNQKGKVASKEEYPSFGNSKSDYDEVVGPFYAIWSSFRTSLTFDHLDKYKTTEAENRTISRLMEKENRKLREPAQKERNERVRALVEFVKKRDKRIKAHKELVELENEFKRQRTAEKHRQQKENFRKATKEYKPSTAFENIDDLEEQLRQLEAQYDTEESVEEEEH